MSKTKWFAVRKPSTGGIIATSANQIVLLKFRRTYKNVLYSPDPPFLLQCWRGVWGRDLGNSKYIKHKLHQNDKHRPYHSNSVLWSFILPSITLLHPCKKSLPFTYDLASVIQRTGWSSPCQPFSHCIPPLPILNYIICRWNRRNTYTGDSTVCICVHASAFGCVGLCLHVCVYAQKTKCLDTSRCNIVSASRAVFRSRTFGTCYINISHLLEKEFMYYQLQDASTCGWGEGN